MISTVEFVTESKCPESSVQNSQSFCKRDTLLPKHVELTNQFITIQTWFLRCAWHEKYNFILKLLNFVELSTSLQLLINILLDAQDKAAVYGECCITTDFVYDKVIADHNRSLEEKTLNEEIQSALHWFDELTSSKQISVLLTLVRMSGGTMARRLYQVVVNLHKDKQCKRYEKNSQLNIIKDLSDPHKLSIVVNSSEVQQNRKILKTDRRKVFYSDKVESEGQENDIHDPEDPLYVEVEKRRKVWKEIIGRYKTQLDKKKGAGQKAIKKKKGKKQQKQSQNKKPKDELDTIQMLPVWVVKKIFGYLDTKTLRKIRTVNKYWDYVIGELLKEKASRKTLNKAISKMQDEEKSVEIYPNLFESRRGLSLFDTIKLKASIRGSTRKKLIIPTKFSIFETSVVTTTEKIYYFSLVLSIYEIKKNAEQAHWSLCG
ncbi:uncharacterized protein LOC108742049 isoform X2 [Agrilus planipennis]|uniref:Uncharacterized protein LOC108742049 isoform X2 n=1 Tax=Agrilus planipennis TaxID=224129 RepID=A0A1W4XJK6_AGRPL|nr:uncharacterized protein LOC108742049 isoform X2 [Agrilus planipennis]